MRDEAGGTGGPGGASHRLPVRVYYEDTDAGGIAYHAAHVRFFERGRTEMLRAVGVSQAELNAAPEAERLLFVVRRITVDYLKPARLDDLLEVTTAVREISGPRITIDQVIRLGETTIATAEVLVVAIGADMRPAKVPEGLARRLRPAR